ncbi:MAG: glycosyltransferase family 2 protein [Verrucomicrobiota bacterium]
MKRAKVFIPVKGKGSCFDSFIEFLFGQDYPNYSIVFAVESEDDPAFHPLVETGAEVVVAGPAMNQSQKVQNQLAAFSKLQPDDEIIVLADADIVGPSSWLRHLLSPINAGLSEVTTGFRWLVPTSVSLPSAIASLVNSASLIFSGPSKRSWMWGGSMALSRQAFDEIGMPGLLEGSFNDDLQISNRVRATRQPFRFVRTVILPTPIDYNWERMWEFGRRQVMQARIYAAKALWAPILAVNLLLVIGFIACWVRFLSGDWVALFPLILVAILNQLRASERAVTANELFDEAMMAKLRPTLRLGRLLTMVSTFFHTLVLLASVFGQTLGWSGIFYRIRGPQEVEVMPK